MYLSLSINKKKLNIILLNFFYFVMGIYIIEGGGVLVEYNLCQRFIT